MRRQPLGTGAFTPLLAAALLVASGVAAQAPAPPAAPAAPPVSPSKGDVVPAFETLGVDGKAARMDFPKGSKTVLLFFLSGCPSCHKMIPEWNRAFERRPKDLKVVGVIMDPDQAPPTFWTTTSIAFPVLRSPGHTFLRGLNVNRAPLTLRVGEGGRIDDLALGVIDPIRLGELFAPVR
jgi:peroxiredoxin